MHGNPPIRLIHLRRSIGFQEASNTQVESLRLQPSYSALFLTTPERPFWAVSQEPETGKQELDESETLDHKFGSSSVTSVTGPIIILLVKVQFI